MADCGLKTGKREKRCRRFALPPQSIGRRLQVVGCGLRVADCRLPIAGCRLRIENGERHLSEFNSQCASLREIRVKGLVSLTGLMGRIWGFGGGKICWRLDVRLVLRSQPRSGEKWLGGRGWSVVLYGTEFLFCRETSHCVTG